MASSIPPMTPFRPCLSALGIAILATALLAGCASNPYTPNAAPIDTGTLPPADIRVEIPGLGPCTDSPDRTLALNASQPVNILVHGCFGSAGRFRTLAQVLAFHGQQTACFSYNDRDSLITSSGQLARAVDALTVKLKRPEITVIGHSQGGLVSRRAVVADRPDPVSGGAALRLVTVSAPFAGIAAARGCGNTALRIGTLGINDLLCWAISGDKWYEITDASSFIRQPGALHGSVREHLKIATDETGSCREYGEDGHCRRDDYVFSIGEQYYPPVDQTDRVKSVEVKAGHVEIVGESGVTPKKLIAVLQNEGVIRPTAPERLAAFRALLAQLYSR